jgi:hypothetical protein
MRGRVVVLAVVLIVAGCSSSGTGGTSRGAGPSAPSSYPADAGNHLTGFGANINTWNQHHRADPDPKLAPNCCYLPKIRFAGQSSLQDTWYALQLDERGQVYAYSRAFTGGSHEAEATALIERDDLPSDARLVKSAVGDGCKLFLYRSAQLDQQMKAGTWISVFYESPGDGTTYSPDNVHDAGLSTGTSDLGSC